MNIPQEGLNDFLSLAQELKLKGLEGGAGTKQEVEEAEQVETPNSKNKPGDGEKLNLLSKSGELTKHESWSEIITVAANPTNYATPELIQEEKYTESRQIINVDQNEDLDRRISELIQLTGDTWSCTVCGKQAKCKGNLKKHIQVHMEGLSYACNNCDKVFRCKTNLNNHTYCLHKLF